MDKENQHIAEAIRSGRYFEEARSWYQVLYIGPISERSFFLIIAALSLIIFLIALSSLVSLMPINARVPVILYAPERVEEVVPNLVRLKEAGDDTSAALEEFMVKQYVLAREGYSFEDFNRNALQVHANSSGEVYAAYQAKVDPQNPQSDAAMLGNKAQRVVDVSGVSLSQQEGKRIASVAFTTEVIGAEDNQKTRWTAKLEYTYTGVDVTTVIDEETGDEIIETTEPQFQVVSYALERK